MAADYSTAGKPGSSRQKKAAIINDFTGFGRCAITVALPIISRLKVQCCPVPTAVFSNHTAYPHYYFDDYTERMQPYIDEWKRMELTFDAIGTGFLGSKQQIEIVSRFIRDFRREDTVVLVDPIMGDDGKAYATYTEEMCGEMRKLAACADIVTPNVTECCILTHTPYKEDHWKEKELERMAEALAEMGPKKVVITGIVQGSYIGNYCYERGGEKRLIRVKKAGAQRCGTGDVFSAVLMADAVNGVPLDVSVKKAADFVKRCILKSEELEVPVTDGVCFEEILDTLHP